jgi:hypothetical protein
MKLKAVNLTIFSFIIILSIYILSNCRSNKYYSSPEEVIQANIDYMNTENIEGTLSTFHPDSPTFEITEDLVEQIFNLYDLNYKIEKLEVVKEDNQEAIVNFTQLTTKLNGPEFKNNRVKGKHILKKDGDSWKIYSTQIFNTEFLN